MVEEFFPSSFLRAKKGCFLNKNERTEWGSNMDAEPPFLAENELEFVVGTGKGTSMNCPLIPRGSSRGYKAYSTRNQFGSNATWVRIPPSAPKAAPCGALLFIFAANYARAARWDSNSPCPALCVPPGCNSPADCCKGAGESHRLRQVSLLNSTLGSDFLLPLCKIPVLFL